MATCDRRMLLSGAAMALLGGCGFRPLYGRPSAPGSTVAELAAIRVEPADDRIAQLVRNRLLDGLNPTGQPLRPRWRLRFTVSESRESVAKQEDDVTTRVSLSLAASYVLTEAAGDRPVTSGVRRAIAGYNVIQSEYANLVADSNAMERAAQQLADAIVRALSVHFARQPEPPA